MSFNLSRPSAGDSPFVIGERARTDTSNPHPPTQRNPQPRRPPVPAGHVANGVMATPSPYGSASDEGRRRYEERYARRKAEEDAKREPQQQQQQAPPPPPPQQYAQQQQGYGGHGNPQQQYGQPPQQQQQQQQQRPLPQQQFQHPQYQPGPAVPQSSFGPPPQQQQHAPSPSGYRAPGGGPPSGYQSPPPNQYGQQQQQQQQQHPPGQAFHQQPPPPQQQQSYGGQQWQQHGQHGPPQGQQHGQPSHGYTSPPPPPQTFSPPPPSNEDHELRSMFAQFDSSRSGQLSYRDLQRLLEKDATMEAREDCIKMLMNIFDTDRSGSINFLEFEGLYRYIQDWHGIFRRFDRDQSGLIDRKELHAALQGFGFSLPGDMVRKLEKRFAPPPRADGTAAQGGISFDRFLMACVTVKHYTEAFRRLDGGTGRATLDYDGFMDIVLDAPS